MMSSYRGTFYTGITNDLNHQVYEHRLELVPGFTKKYKVSKLVYWQATESLEFARARENQIEGWRRSKEVEPVETASPDWMNLANSWDERVPPPQALSPASGRKRVISRNPHT